MDSIIKYYQNLLIEQFNGKLKARGDVAIKTKIATGDFIFIDFYKNFDVDTAVGVQLDLIGKIVGLNRVVYGFDFFTKYFSYNDFDDPMPTSASRGYSDIGFPVSAIFKDYDQSTKSIYAMTDTIYQQMIKLKILINNAVATNKFIDDSLLSLFSNGILATNNFDMTMTLRVHQDYAFQASLANYLGLLPSPCGVGIDIVYL